MRAEIGDLSGKHGRLRGNQNRPLFFQDSQVIDLFFRTSSHERTQSDIFLILVKCVLDSIVRPTLGDGTFDRHFGFKR